MSLKIAPSILSANFGKLNEEIASVEPFVELLHLDIMDGHFVPNITIGPAVVSSIKTRLPLDLHLMIEQPENFIDEFVKAGADSITVHQETCLHLHRVLRQIKAAGVRAAVSINPATPVIEIREVLPLVDMVLVMSVNPGFGGQKFIPEILHKIKDLGEIARKENLNFEIEVDGGINAETAKLCREAGADILVAGSYIFGATDRKEAIEKLRT